METCKKFKRLKRKFILFLSCLTFLSMMFLNPIPLSGPKETYAAPAVIPKILKYGWQACKWFFGVAVTAYYIIPDVLPEGLDTCAEQWSYFYSDCMSDCMCGGQQTQDACEDKCMDEVKPQWCDIVCDDGCNDEPISDPPPSGWKSAKEICSCDEMDTLPSGALPKDSCLDLNGTPEACGPVFIP